MPSDINTMCIFKMPSDIKS